MKNLVLVSVLMVFAGFSLYDWGLPAAEPPANTESSSTIRNSVLLPVEVMGPDGTTEAITLMATDIDRVQRLKLKAHSISYPDFMGYAISKASIRLNGGEWVDIDNNVAECAYPESQYECVVGPYATVRFTIDIDYLGAVHPGENTLEFRFNYQSGDISSGYRILEVDLLNDDGTSALDGTRFVYDNPKTWKPSTTDPARLANGRRLYESRGILIDYPGGPPIRAACADCHTAGGRDLKYFNFSDRSIIARSVFHGFSEEEGQDIAAWVRSYELTDKNGQPYDAPGTPWDPPYQPGPGLDSRPVEQWAAGAGLEWVLDHDSTMFRYLFPDGNLAKTIDIDGTLNRRELPIALQLPDWNEWLPVIHPLDTWGDDFEASDAWRKYNDSFEGELKDPQRIKKLIEEKKIDQVIEDFFNEVKDFARHDGPAGLPRNVTRRGRGTVLLGLYQWDLVKTWEFMQDHHLEDIASGLYPQGETRSWIGEARTVFNLAPHIHGASKGLRGDVTNTYFDTAWYELQVILNSGNRETASLKPVDWKYHFSHIGDWKKASGVSHGLRYLAGYLKVLQNANNRFGVTMPNGFYLRHTTLAWIHDLAMPDGGKNALYELDEIRPYLKRDLAEAFTRAMLTKLMRHDYAEWDRREGKDGIEPASYVPTYNERGRGGRGMFDQTSYADHFYRIIPLFNELGVSPALLDSLAQWGKGAWPEGDWDHLVVETSGR